MIAHSLTRADVSRAILAAMPNITVADLRRATGAAVRAMIGATDTGRWHGPVEGFIVDDLASSLHGHGIESSSNGAITFATTRVERRARDLRDIGTLRALAREHRATGAHAVADHCETLASIFAASAAWRAMPYGASIAPESDLADHRPGAATAYHTTTDMYVRVVGITRNGACFLIDHPQVGRMECPLWAIDPDTV